MGRARLLDAEEVSIVARRIAEDPRELRRDKVENRRRAPHSRANDQGDASSHYRK